MNINVIGLDIEKPTFHLESQPDYFNSEDSSESWKL